jgi:hypothetical protein
MAIDKVEPTEGTITNTLEEGVNDVASTIGNGVKSGLNSVMGATSDVITTNLSPDTADKIEDAGNLLGTVIKGAEGPIKESLTLATEVAEKEGPKFVNGIMKSFTESMKAMPGLGTVLAASTAATAGLETATAGFHMVNAFTEAGKKIADKVTDTVEHPPLPNIQNPISNINNPISNMNNPISNSVFQHGGRKTRREKKQMERRINKSLTSFYNPLNTKTKKVRRGTRKRRRK